MDSEPMSKVTIQFTRGILRISRRVGKEDKSSKMVIFMKEHI